MSFLLRIGCAALLVGCAPKLSSPTDDLPAARASLPGETADAKAAYLQARVAEERGDLEAARQAWRRLAHLDPAYLDRLSVGDERAPTLAQRLVVLEQQPTAEGLRGVLEDARSSCRLGTVWSWALEQELAGHDRTGARLGAVHLGLAVRDVVMVEQAAQGLTLSSDVLHEWAALELRLGRPTAALQVVDRASELDPMLELLRGSALLELGREEQGLVVLGRVGEPWTARAALTGAEHLMELGRAAEALEWAGRALDAQPTDQAALVKGMALQALGRVAEAEQVLSEQKVDPRVRARLHLARGDGPGAVALLRAEIAAGSNPARMDLARIYEGQGIRAPAIQAWQAVVRQSPSELEGWMALARLHPPARAQALNGALEADPCHAPALAEQARGRPAAEARHWLERAVDAAPGWARGWKALADVLEALDLEERAQKARATARRLTVHGGDG